MCIARVFVGVFGCVICSTLIECGSKKALRKTQGWLPGGFAESRGNFPHRRPSSVVCQPPLAPLAAIVPTAVNHAAYESKQQSIALLMNLNSSQLLSVGIHRHIWCFQLVTWIASNRTSWGHKEINWNKYLPGKRIYICFLKKLPKTSSPWKSHKEDMRWNIWYQVNLFFVHLTEYLWPYISCDFPHNP